MNNPIVLIFIWILVTRNQLLSQPTNNYRLLITLWLVSNILHLFQRTLIFITLTANQCLLRLLCIRYSCSRTDYFPHRVMKKSLWYQIWLYESGPCWISSVFCCLRLRAYNCSLLEWFLRSYHAHIRHWDFHWRRIIRTSWDRVRIVSVVCFACYQFSLNLNLTWVLLVWLRLLNIMVVKSQPSFRRI